MSQPNTIEQLNEQLATANAALEEALENGGDSTAPRYQIGLIEAEIAATVRRRREEKAEAERVERAAIAQAAAEVATQTHDAAVVAIEVPRLAELAGTPLPAVTQDPAIEAAAREVARCRATLSAAETTLKPIADQAERLNGRLNEKCAAIEAIKARRLAGEEKPSDAAEMALLQADIDALQLLVDDARMKAQSADSRQQARAALATAEQQLEQARRQVEYRAALARVELAQEVFLDAFGVMVRAGRAAGQSSPWAAYKASQNLVRAVTGQIVAGASNPFFN